jgi:hypothetical protein
MTDAALENALARRDLAARRLKEIADKVDELMDAMYKVREEMQEIDRFIRMWHEMAGIQPPAELEQSKIEEAVDRPKRIRPKNPPREAVAEACVNYIREAGRPLMRAELLDQLTADGIVIRGKDPAMVLSTMLWRSKDIIRRLPEGGYWPAGELSQAEVLLKELGIEPQI